MKNIKSYQIFEQDAQLKTKTFNGVPRYPAVADYLGIITKNADSGSNTEITTFLKKRPKIDQPTTNGMYLLKFMEEALANIKAAQPDLYGKITGEMFAQKIKDATTIK